MSLVWVCDLRTRSVRSKQYHRSFEREILRDMAFPILVEFGETIEMTIDKYNARDTHIASNRVIRVSSQISLF